MIGIAITGEARLAVREGVIDDGELEDPARVAFDVPVAVTLNDGEVAESTFFFDLEDLPFDVLPWGDLPLTPASEDSTIYLRDRHRPVTTLRLNIGALAADETVFTVRVVGEIDLETQTEPFELTFRVVPTRA